MIGFLTLQHRQSANIPVPRHRRPLPAHGLKPAQSNCRNRVTALMMPNTGYTVCLR